MQTPANCAVQDCLLLILPSCEYALPDYGCLKRVLLKSGGLVKIQLC